MGHDMEDPRVKRKTFKVYYHVYYRPPAWCFRNAFVHLTDPERSYKDRKLFSDIRLQKTYNSHILPLTCHFFCAEP